MLLSCHRTPHKVTPQVTPVLLGLTEWLSERERERGRLPRLGSCVSGNGFQMWLGSEESEAGIPCTFLALSGVVGDGCRDLKVRYGREERKGQSERRLADGGGCGLFCFSPGSTFGKRVAGQGIIPLLRRSLDRHFSSSKLGANVHFRISPWRCNIACVSAHATIFHAPIWSERRVVGISLPPAWLALILAVPASRFAQQSEKRGSVSTGRQGVPCQAVRAANCQPRATEGKGLACANCGSDICSLRWSSLKGKAAQQTRRTHAQAQADTRRVKWRGQRGGTGCFVHNTMQPAHGSSQRPSSGPGGGSRCLEGRAPPVKTKPKPKPYLLAISKDRCVCVCFVCSFVLPKVGHQKAKPN